MRRKNALNHDWLCELFFFFLLKCLPFIMDNYNHSEILESYKIIFDLFQANMQSDDMKWEFAVCFS